MSSMPYDQGNFMYVLPGGQVTLRVQFQTYLGSGQPAPSSGVQVTIAPAQGGTPVYGPASDQITAADQANYTLDWRPATTTPPGDYTVTWTAASPPQQVTQVVTVVALPAEAPSPGVYATVTQYQDETGDYATPRARVKRELRSASRTIDRALIGAVYPTDADSMPTNPAHIDLFMRTTCAQASFQIANNDPDHVKQQYASQSMGGVSQSRTARAQGQVLPPLAPAAAEILQVDGALPSAPLISW